MPAWWAAHPNAWRAATWTAATFWAGAAWGSVASSCGYPEEPIVYDYGSDLPHDLDPGESVEVEIHVPAPSELGQYIVEFDMVAEHIAWFEDYGSGTLRHELAVEN